MTTMHRGNWEPDVQAIADQLISDYLLASQENADDPLEAMGQGDLAAIATLESWRGSAEFHGEDCTEDDWIALVQELARRAGGADA
jgi:hypothetical protein